MLFGICDSLACQCFGQRTVKMAELPLFIWLFGKLNWANEALDLIYSIRDTNSLNFSAFNRNKWEIFLPLPTTLSYCRALKTDKDEVVLQGYTRFFQPVPWALDLQESVTLSSHERAWEQREATSMLGAVHWWHRRSPPLRCPHPLFIENDVSYSTAVQTAIAFLIWRQWLIPLRGNPWGYHLVLK